MANRRDKASFFDKDRSRQRHATSLARQGLRHSLWGGEQHPMGGTTTPWKQDGGNASNFSRQTVPLSFPVASAAIFSTRDRGNGS
jgi:hypothetical protein